MKTTNLKQYTIPELKDLIYAEYDSDKELPVIQQLALRVLTATIEDMEHNYYEAQEEQAGFAGTTAETLIIDMLRWN